MVYVFERNIQNCWCNVWKIYLCGSVIKVLFGTFVQIQICYAGNIYLFKHKLKKTKKNWSRIFFYQINKLLNITCFKYLKLCHGMNIKYLACIYIDFHIHLVLMCKDKILNLYVYTGRLFQSRIHNVLDAWIDCILQC